MKFTKGEIKLLMQMCDLCIVSKEFYARAKRITKIYEILVEEFKKEDK